MPDRPRPTRRRVLVITAGIAAAVVVFALGAFLGTPLRDAVTPGGRGSIPDQVLDVISDRYRGPVDRAELERVGARAIAESLGDRYTSYLDPGEWDALQRAAAGAYTGIGIRIRRDGNALVIREVFPDSPASRVGLRAGDEILAVGGVPVARRGLAKSVEAILGREGTPVTLRIRTGGGTMRVVRPVRGEVTVPVVEGRIVTGPTGARVAVITLNRFEKGAADRVGDEARRLLGEGATAMVFDLRRNPGGLLDEAVAVAGVFLPPGTEVVSTSGRASPTRVLSADGDPIPADVPVAVLVDHESASASEIVAGALKDHGRAEIVGMPTFGKSKVQVTVPTSDGGAVRVTIADYLTPKGTDIGKGGVRPGVRASDDAGTEADEALQKALAGLVTQGG